LGVSKIMGRAEKIMGGLKMLWEELQPTSFIYFYTHGKHNLLQHNNNNYEYCFLFKKIHIIYCKCEKGQSQVSF